MVKDTIPQGSILEVSILEVVVFKVLTRDGRRCNTPLTFET